jgi:hypothetical protein
VTHRGDIDESNEVRRLLVGLCDRLAPHSMAADETAVDRVPPVRATFST